MVFSSLPFLFLFLPLTLLLYYTFPQRVKNILLMFVSLLFYAWGEPYFVLVMIASILLNFLFAFWVDRFGGEGSRRAKLVLICMVFANLSIFFVFKYLGFFLSNIQQILPAIDITIPTINLPIGISFFTFQAMSYVFDVYYKNAKVQKNPLNVALYISLFPQLIAGPIVRYKSIADQIDTRKESISGFCDGICRFTLGLGKKVILANSMALIADGSFALSPLGEISALQAWFGALAYAFQIYFDFSGYSDMAIGLGKMFGFNFDENFNYPYISRSITEFWRRWHISLGSWFRDYVYIPLGGSRGSSARTIGNLFVVWFLTGLWHGASWNFIAWGLFYYVLLCLEKFIYPGLAKIYLPPNVLRRLYTLFCILVGWVLFRSPSLSYSIRYIQSMFYFANNELTDDMAVFTFADNALLFVLCAVLATPLFKAINQWAEKQAVLRVPVRISQLVGYMGILGICVIYLVVSGYNPFIYFNF